ncbi:TPA: hypothetical protein EYP37_13525, partial [Candidatus Poribacteria bacterium]|nr:hypothetical protein [Candidatus Poribacteria bacterium]
MDRMNFVHSPSNSSKPIPRWLLMERSAPSAAAVFSRSRKGSQPRSVIRYSTAEPDSAYARRTFPSDRPLKSSSSLNGIRSPLRAASRS